MNTAGSLLAAATLIAINPHEIDVDLSGRIGFYFEDKAAAFASMFLADGQRDPIKVPKALNRAIFDTYANGPRDAYRANVSEAVRIVQEKEEAGR